MPCYSPITAWQSIKIHPQTNKTTILFKPPRMYSKAFNSIQLPCGQCIGCRLERSRQWAIRCVHEAELHEENCFITLTFSPENINKKGTLIKADFQKFMKRLRKKYIGKVIRYMHCGEYGEIGNRPHHHACIFGLDFKDKIYWKNSESGKRIYTSETLNVSPGMTSSTKKGMRSPPENSVL